jgi:hypothetical protein
MRTQAFRYYLPAFLSRAVDGAWLVAEYTVMNLDPSSDGTRAK